MKEILLSVAVIAVLTYLIRLLPLVLFKKKITNIYVQSFMEYIPCVVLSCMTFPAIFTCTQNVFSSLAGSVTAIFLGWKSRSLVEVACAAVVSALAVELLISLFTSTSHYFFIF